MPITRESLGGATHGVDCYGVPAYVRFEPAETTTFFRVFPNADDRKEVGEGVRAGFGTAPKGVRIGTPSTATIIFEEPVTPVVSMSVSPGAISENGGVSRISAWVGIPQDHDITVTARVQTSDSATADDFTVSENRTLTIFGWLEAEHGNGDGHGGEQLRAQPDEYMWVHGAVTNLPGVTEASYRTLYIEDDDPLGVTLKLTPSSISEDGGVSMVTATPNGTASDDVTVTVAAAPLIPAVAGNFTLTGTTLTITAGQTSSAGTLTITRTTTTCTGRRSR